MNVYFDNAATTALDPEVIEAMLPYLKEGFGNPSSTHSYGRNVKTAIEKARRTIAELLNASPSEIYFTSGGTEADNTFLRGIVETEEIQVAITSALEHHAVLHTLEDLAAKGKLLLHLVEHNAEGQLNLDHLASLLKENPKSLVSLMHGNNEIGNLNEIEKIAALCQEHGAFFHSDTVQTIGYFNYDLKQLPLHSLVGAGHKFHGPKGVGFLYVRKGLSVAPFITGGGQERSMRGGTENTYGIIGLAKALERSLHSSREAVAHMQSLKEYMLMQLERHFPQEFKIHGKSSDLANSLPSVLNVGFSPRFGGGMLLFQLDLQGVAASGGSACSSGASVGSHVIRALNLPQQYTPVRFSFDKHNTKEEIDYAISVLQAIREGQAQPTL